MSVYDCKVTIVNATDAAQNVVLTAISGVFYYSDHTVSSFGSVPVNAVNLQAGQRTSYDSTPGKYVTQFVFHVTATDRSTGQERILQYQNQAPPGYLLSGEWIYGVQV